MSNKPAIQDQLIHDNPRAQAPASRWAWTLLTIALWCALIGALVPSALDMAYALADWLLTLQKRDWIVFVASVGLVVLGIRAARRRDPGSRSRPHENQKLAGIHSAPDLEALRAARRIVAHHNQRGQLSSVELAPTSDVVAVAAPSENEPCRETTTRAQADTTKTAPTAPAGMTQDDWTLERVRDLLNKYRQPLPGVSNGSGVAARSLETSPDSTPESMPNSGAVERVGPLKVKSIRIATTTLPAPSVIRLAQPPAPATRPASATTISEGSAEDSAAQDEAADQGHANLGPGGLIMIQVPAPLPWTNRPRSPVRRPVKYLLLASALSLLLSFESAAAPGLAPRARQDQLKPVKLQACRPANARDPPFGPACMGSP